MQALRTQHLRISKLLSRPPDPEAAASAARTTLHACLKGRFGSTKMLHCMLACEVRELHDDDMQQIDGRWCTLGDHYLLLCSIVLRLPQQLAVCCC